MNADNIGTISTILTAVVALASIGLAVWVSLSTAGRPRFLALLGLGCALFGRFVGVLVPMFNGGWDGLGASMIIQNLLTVVGMGLLSWALVEALRDWSADEDPGFSGGTTPASDVQYAKPVANGSTAH